MTVSRDYDEIFKKYLKSKGVKDDEERGIYISCENLNCKYCIFGDGDEFKRCRLCGPIDRITIKWTKKQIKRLKEWNGEWTKEQIEKNYAEIQQLTAQMGKLIKEITRLYKKIDQLEKGEENDQ